MDFQQLHQLTRSIGLQAGPSENHGSYCGLLCGGHPEAEAVWMAELFVDLDPLDLLVCECAEGLRELAGQTREAIDGPGLGFDPFLPDDEVPITERAAALRDWCRGFLYGLGLSGTHEHQLSEVAMEALGDLSRMAQFDAEAPLECEPEQDEDAYAELTEFTWVAAMLIYEERAERRGAA